jgi:hypothetical protein
VIVDGEVEVTSAAGLRVSGGGGLLVEFAPTERHEVVARSKARLLLLLTPWPGAGHPGAMTIGQKLTRDDAPPSRESSEAGAWTSA